VPLILIDLMHQEKKFSGTREAGKNGETFLGTALDAYAHHVLDDSSGMFLLADIQGKYIVLIGDIESHIRLGVVSSNDDSVILMDPNLHS